MRCRIIRYANVFRPTLPISIEIFGYHPRMLPGLPRADPKRRCG